jgi:hypothetical protein
LTDDFVSQLPPYRAKRSDSFPAFLVVYCGHADCPGTAADRPFLVAEREWLRPNRRKIKRGGVEKEVIIVGRSCPYCFRTGRVPRRSEIRAS